MCASDLLGSAERVSSRRHPQKFPRILDLIPDVDARNARGTDVSGAIASFSSYAPQAAPEYTYRISHPESASSRLDPLVQNASEFILEGEEYADGSTCDPD